MLTAMLILTALVLRALYLQVRLGSSVQIRKERKGWLTLEVRRRVGMEKIPEHVSEFPVPREERIQVYRLLGVILWHDEMSIALPNSACECFEKVSPQDYDREFPRWLRLANNAR
jgi:hypothetical protein